MNPIFSSNIIDGLKLVWRLVAPKQECSGSDIDIGRTLDIKTCAEKCQEKSSMFIYGTNDWGNNRCFSDGCNCACETAANSDGTCNRIDHTGYRLFKYDKGGSCRTH